MIRQHTTESLYYHEQNGNLLSTVNLDDDRRQGEILPSPWM